MNGDFLLSMSLRHGFHGVAKLTTHSFILLNLLLDCCVCRHSESYMVYITPHTIIFLINFLTDEMLFCFPVVFFSPPLKQSFYFHFSVLTLIPKPAKILGTWTQCQWALKRRDTDAKMSYEMGMGGLVLFLLLRVYIYRVEEVCLWCSNVYLLL